MRPSLPRLASNVSALPLQQATSNILPPIPLYRRLLRAHRKLPAPMRVLGDRYLYDEFRRHRTADNPLHVIGFLSSWKIYLDQLEQEGSDAITRGRRLDPEMLDKLSPEQVGQLYELMHAAKAVWKSPAEIREAGEEVLREAEATAVEEAQGEGKKQ